VLPCELIRADAFGVNMKEVRRLMEFQLVFGDDGSRQDHASAVLGQVCGEPMSKCLATPEASA
jgi:hypothetical protein